jgi:hypothetical protein
MKGLPVLLLCTTCLSAAWPRNPSLAQLHEAIAARGIAQVADELNRQNDPDPWNSIEEHIATGAPAWLNLAMQLRAYTDGGASLGLENAVAEALPKNPNAVLKMLGTDRVKEFTVQRVCSAETFIETPESKLRRHLQQSRIVVEHVTDPQLQQAKRACAEVLNAALKNKALPAK